MRLLELANEYCKESDWKTLAVLKICLLSLGVMAGMQVPKKYRKRVCCVCGVVFAASYLPLMAKLVRLYIGRKKGE